MPHEYPGAEPAPTGAESPTALLPYNAFGDKTPEPGDVCSFRVVNVYDDQVEVEYVPHGEEGGEGEEYAPPPEEAAIAPPPGQGEMTEFLG